MIIFALFRKQIVFRTAHSYGFSYHSSCSQYYKDFLLLQAPSDLLTSGPITTSDEETGWPLFLISADFVKLLLDSSRLLFKSIDSPKFCVVSLSLRALCACLFSTWQHWISIGPLSTICSFMFHLLSAQGNGIYLGIEGQSSLQYLPNTNLLFDHYYSKAEAFFFDRNFRLHRISRPKSSSTALSLSPKSYTVL